MDEINEDLWGNNRNKRKFQDESLEIHVAAKHTCFCLERSSTQSNIQLDITRNSMSANDHSNSSSQESADAVMSVSDDSINHLLHPHSTSSSSSSSSVNWNGTSFDRSDTKTCEDDISAYNAYACPSSEDCEFSSSECVSKQSMEDLFCSNVVVANNSVLSSGRWNVNEDTEQGTKKLTIDKEFEQYFSMLML